MEQPTASLEWLPASMAERPSMMLNGPAYTTYQLLTGTRGAGGTTDYLNFVGVDIPTQPLAADNDAEAALFPAASKMRVLAQVPHRDLSSASNGDDQPLPTSTVHVARHNPADATQIASLTDDGTLLLFKTSLADLTLAKSVCAAPTTRAFTYHTQAGRALDWNKNASGVLATGADDARIAVWDINSDSPEPKYTLESAHEGPVTAVRWSPHMPTVLASVSADGSLVISDTRASDFASPVIRIPVAHPVPATPSDKPGSPKEEEEEASAQVTAAAVNDVAFSPFHAHLLATAGSDGTVRVWDLRRLFSSASPSTSTATPLHTLRNGHADAVNTVAWSPHSPSVLCSGGADRRALLWDLSRIDPDNDSDEDGPPELLFVHGGHTAGVTACEWHPELEWVVASTAAGDNDSASNNVVQVWKPAAEIVRGEYQEEDEEERAEGEEMEE